MTEDDIPDGVGEQAVQALLEGEDFAQFLASVNIAANEYARNRGLSLGDAGPRSLVQNLELTPNILSLTTR